MIPLTGAVKIYYCRTPINLHRSFDGLPGAVEEYLKQDPKSGHLFVFFNRTCRMVKILYREGDGYAIWSKRLVQGMFNIPRSAEGKILLEARELQAILSGNHEPGRLDDQPFHLAASVYENCRIPDAAV